MVVSHSHLIVLLNSGTSLSFVTGFGDPYPPSFYSPSFCPSQIGDHDYDLGVKSSLEKAGMLLKGRSLVVNAVLMVKGNL